MEFSEKQIIEEIVGYIRSCRYSSDSWYAGLTSDPLRCLQYEHGISFENNLCILREVPSIEAASRIVTVLIDRYGLDGRSLEIDAGSSVHVYAFHKKERGNE